MNLGKYVFSQVVSVMDPNDFNVCVARYKGNYNMKGFTCWHQLLCMMFGQLANRESLSDLVLCLQTQRNKWYHLGIGTKISKSNLANANEKRDWRMFSDFAYLLIAEARKNILPNEDLGVFGDNAIYAVDTTTIDLCLDVFWWAKFRKNKGAIKLHTVLDIRTEIPCYIHVTDGKVHEVNVLDILEFEVGGFYVMDRGFVDYERLFIIHHQLAYFVTRAKTNMKCRRLYSAKVDRSTGVMYDQTIMLINFYALKEYPEKLRRIKFTDSETNKQFIFLTNNFELPALQVALLYKYRWEDRTVLQMDKTALEGKVVLGTFRERSEGPGLYRYHYFCRSGIGKTKTKTPLTQYQILQILSLTLINKTQLNQLFQDALLQYVKEPESNQLKMF